METTTTNSLQLIATNDVVAIIETAPAVLDRNKQAIEKINQKAKYLLDKRTELGMSAELDAELNDFLVKVRDAKAAALARRTNLTQLFDSVKKSFTTIEAAMDPKTEGTMVAAVQEARNEWARTLAEQEKKRLQDELLKKNQAAELTGLTYKIESRFREHFKLLLNEQLTQMQETFNKLTLPKFEEMCNQIKAAPENYPHGHFMSFSPDFTREVIYNPKEIAEDLVAKTKDSGLYDVLFNEWLNAVQNKKQSLVDMMPGKLESLKKAEDARIAAEEAEQERKRQEIIQAQAEEAARAATSAAEAERARAAAQQAEIDRRIAEQRRQELEVQAAAQKAEEEAREKEMELQQKREAAERDDKAQKEVELRKSAQEAHDLFNHTASVAEPTTEQAGQIRSGYEIIVKAPAGWMLILNLWFQHEGGKLALDKFETKKLGSIKGWCEKHCYKTGEKISSPLIEYKETYTAVSTK